ncbi:E3 ubiquitin-protein ligase MIB2-like isoform X2 [Octopus sinensis]|uniref:E3 ubiquitin-protein ligase MIB2-like isoform X2 n=2 Tax=Octopus sinensis TaxID=2607531 RepID=A0A7E6EIZ7_9MOLL|nr:E3 ubiquitin-protein ligase MIB2-like isoform X2 [Octopus sinensis]
MASIFYKIYHNDVKGLKTLLKKKPSQINEPIDLFGTTPLMLAFQEGADRRIIEILLEAGAELGTKDQWGRSALHFAVEWDRPYAVEILLSRGCYVNPRNVNGQTPLHWACDRGHLHIVELLLSHNGIDANVMNDDGDTPLHDAVQKRKYKLVFLLLNQDSVNLEIVNKEYRTPLLEAVSDGHLGIIQRLIARGANVNAVDHGGNNCLHLALKRENNFRSEVEHMTMLDQYCVELELGNEERYSGVVLASYLAHHGANFYCKNKSGRTPLDLIKKENLKKMLKTLFSPQCRWCQENMATVRLQPCGDIVFCENCFSEITFKRCPVCREYTLSKSEFGAPKFEDMCVKTEATCQELGAASQAIARPIFEDKEVQTVEEPRAEYRMTLHN